jgi:4-amino-4-deoxychorismate lyase
VAESIVFLNGEFIPENLATIPISDRGFLFGEGIFTTIRVYQGHCEFLEGHIHRLENQTKELGIQLDQNNFSWVDELIQRNQALEGIWRLKIIVTHETVLATLHPFLGKTSEPCTLTLFPHPCVSPLASLKTLSYLDHLTVRKYGESAGFNDAITTTEQGLLLETGCSNLFWIDQDQFFFPDPTLPYLKGVFLQALFSNLSLPLHSVKASLDQIPLTASVYTCNALTHARPVLKIDQCAYPRNAQYEALLEQTAERVIANYQS